MKKGSKQQYLAQLRHLHHGADVRQLILRLRKAAITEADLVDAIAKGKPAGLIVSTLLLGEEGAASAANALRTRFQAEERGNHTRLEVIRVLQYCKREGCRTLLDLINGPLDHDEEFTVAEVLVDAGTKDPQLTALLCRLVESNPWDALLLVRYGEPAALATIEACLRRHRMLDVDDHDLLGLLVRCYRWLGGHPEVYVPDAPLLDSVRSGVSLNDFLDNVCYDRRPDELVETVRCLLERGVVQPEAAAAYFQHVETICAELREFDCMPAAESL